MLDRFPPEILLEVLAWTRFCVTSSHGTLEAQRTLCRCALVCRALDSAAEALLWRKIEIKSADGLKQLLDGSGEDEGWARLRAVYQLEADGRLGHEYGRQGVPQPRRRFDRQHFRRNVVEMTKSEAASFGALSGT